MFTLLVGEIGITTGQFYYGLRWWEIKSIIRGYNRRHRDQWSAVRWQTYNLMCAFTGSKSLNEAGIHGPKDLLPLSWDKDDLDNLPPMSEDEKAQLQADMDAWQSLQQQQAETQQ